MPASESAKYWNAACNSGAAVPSTDPGALPFTGSQTDTNTCLLNAALSTLSNSLSKRLGQTVSIDLGRLYCILKEKGNVQGRLRDPAIDKAFEIVTKYGFNQNSPGYVSYFIYFYIIFADQRSDSRTPIPLLLPITCSKTKQNINDTNCSEPVNKDCLIRAQVSVQHIDIGADERIIFNRILTQIKNNGVIASLPTGADWYLWNKLNEPQYQNNPTEPVVITIPDSENNLVPRRQPNAPANPCHAVTIIAYDCDGEYITFTVQDSYPWGGDPNNNIRVYDIRVNRNTYPFLSYGFPFSVVDAASIVDFGSNRRVISLALANPDLTTIKNQLKKCCGGACCKNGQCTDYKTERECENNSGTWYPGEECTPELCATTTPPPSTTPPPQTTYRAQCNGAIS